MDEQPYYRVLIESGINATGHEGIKHISVEVYVTTPATNDDEDDDDCATGITGCIELSTDCTWTDDWYTTESLEELKSVHPEAYFFAQGLLQAAQGQKCL